MLIKISEGTMDIDEFCASFINWHKASDCANWAKIMQILRCWYRLARMRLNGKLCAYTDQIFKLRLAKGKRRRVKTGKGVRQGCGLLLILFNLYR